MRRGMIIWSHSIARKLASGSDWVSWWVKRASDPKPEDQGQEINTGYMYYYYMDICIQNKNIWYNYDLLQGYLLEELCQSLFFQTGIFQDACTTAYSILERVVSVQINSLENNFLDQSTKSALTKIISDCKQNFDEIKVRLFSCPLNQVVTSIWLIMIVNCLVFLTICWTG